MPLLNRVTVPARAPETRLADAPVPGGLVRSVHVRETTSAEGGRQVHLDVVDTFEPAPPGEPSRLEKTSLWLRVRQHAGLTFSWTAPPRGSLRLEVAVADLASPHGAGADLAAAVKHATLLPPLVRERREVPVRVEQGQLVLEVDDVSPPALGLPLLLRLELTNGEAAVLEVATRVVRRDDAARRRASLPESISVTERLVADGEAQRSQWRAVLEAAEARGEDWAVFDSGGTLHVAALRAELVALGAGLAEDRERLAAFRAELAALEAKDHRAHVVEAPGLWR